MAGRAAWNCPWIEDQDAAVIGAISLMKGAVPAGHGPNFERIATGQRATTCPRTSSPEGCRPGRLLDAGRSCPQFRAATGEGRETIGSGHLGSRDLPADRRSIEMAKPMG
jgi:hypothetical protein